MIEHVRLADNRFRGIMLFAKHATVRRTNITNTGGTTVFEDAYAMGIEMHGDYCRVYENFLSDIYPSGAGEGVGISLSGSDADNCIVESNSVLNNRQSESGQTIGLWPANRAMVRSNNFVNHTYSIAGSYRDRQNTVRNIAVGENCHGLLYSMANAGTDTLYLPIPFTHCPDVMDAALAKLDWSDRHSLFRMGRLLRLLGKPEEAIIYFRAAALLGSTEAQQADWLEQAIDPQ